MRNLPDWLLRLNIPEDCISSQSAVKEKGKVFVITPQQGDEVWQVKLDGCWWFESNKKKVDYLFWVGSASGKKLILLVELKGNKFGVVLDQIESTLNFLCKKGLNQGIHSGIHHDSPGHNAVCHQGVHAYAILSSGRNIPQRLREREKIRPKYGVVVHPKTKKLAVKGVDQLP